MSIRGSGVDAAASDSKAIGDNNLTEHNFLLAFHSTHYLLSFPNAWKYWLLIASHIFHPSPVF